MAILIADRQLRAVDNTVSYSMFVYHIPEVLYDTDCPTDTQRGDYSLFTIYCRLLTAFDLVY